MLRWPYDQVRLPKGLPARGVAVAVDAEHLAAERPLLLRLGRVACLAGGDEKVALAVEQEAAAVVSPAHRDAGQNRADVAEPAAVELDADDAIVL